MTDDRYKTAAIEAGWGRNEHNGYFVGPVGSPTRMADYDSWQELCEVNGIEVPTPLGELREAAEKAYWVFIDTCLDHSYADEWQAYRAEEAGVIWPDDLATAHRTYITALHAFYLLRDGPNGFLGGKGQ
jgi:hypothetical protein